MTEDDFCVVSDIDIFAGAPQYPEGAIHRSQDRRNYLRDNAESPIEFNLGGSLLESYKFVVVPHEHVGFKLTKYEVAFVMQHPVGPYRIDIGLFFHSIGGVFHKIAIECDGKAYHEGTQNRLRDDKRDAYLRSLGFEVWRYPGWLLHHRPGEAADEIQEATVSLINGCAPTLKLCRDSAQPAA
jgi:very-short-patch-repair endonuclease